MQRRGSRRAPRRGPRIGQPAGILAAGGRGSRVGGSTLKQFQDIAGKPLLRWSFDSMVAGGCDPVIVAVPSGSIDLAKRVLDGRGVIVSGGQSRQESVLNCLTEVGSENAIVHDGARPFATPDGFQRVIAALTEFDGAGVALPVHETLKRVEDKVETLSRDRLWKAQTPQGFRTTALKECHRRARDEGFIATDDLQLLERYGYAVTLLEGSSLNIKITYAEDFDLAEALARSR